MIIWLSKPPAPKMLGGHAHRCPECYEPAPCESLCSIEIDLYEDGDTPMGGYTECDACAELRRIEEERR